MSDIRYRKMLMLTPEESMKLVELAKQLEMSQSQTVGLLIKLARVSHPAQKQSSIIRSDEGVEACIL
jgi:hypothetical protein